MISAKKDQYEFIPDKSIESFEEDELERGQFARSLASRLENWSRKDSLVVGVFGEWGSGKSSIIRLTLAAIRQDTSAPVTVIELNPWAVTGSADVVEFFYNEVAKVLRTKKSSKDDRKIAAKLRYYSSILRLAPSKSSLARASQVAIILFAGASIASWWTLAFSVFWKAIFFIVGVFLLAVSIFASFLERIATMLDAKSVVGEKPLQDIKNELCDLLRKREGRILIVIDDIDRLTREEIRKTIAVIKANADLPNTIYLLPFDQEVVEACFDTEVKKGQGKRYIEKVVEVSFDVPHAKPTKIIGFLTRHLDVILARLPHLDEKYFESHWQNIFFSGFRDMFRTVRDVKRYLNSLSFNISLLSQNETLEVDPVDFFAIEAIRVFQPPFYSALKFRKELFTRIPFYSEETSGQKAEIEKMLELIPEDSRASVLELIKRLFPLVGGLYSNTHYSDGHQRDWNRHLLVCSIDYFDRYFTLVPGGSEEDISEYELKVFFAALESAQKVEDILRDKIKRGKIRQFLDRLQDYTDDEKCIPLKFANNLILGLFDISDDLPRDRVSLSDLGADMNSMRIIFQTLRRQSDKERNYEILRRAIVESKQLFGPVQKMSLEPDTAQKRPEIERLVEMERVPELRQACLEKIYSFAGNGRLLENKDPVYILFRWREWDKSGKLLDYLEEVQRDHDTLLKFVSKFVVETTTQGLSDYAVERERGINFNYLARFINLTELRAQAYVIRSSKTELYKQYQEIVDTIVRELSDDNIRQILERNRNDDIEHDRKDKA